MARYTGPRLKLARREKTDLYLTAGERDIKDKCNWETLPGVHGSANSRISDFGVQLREKQKVRRIYGVLERQFRNYFKKASRQDGATGTNLLRLLETRLDNIVYRAGFARTRAEARQLVSHRHVMVNGSKVNIPSFQVSVDDIVSIKQSSRDKKSILDAVRIAAITERTEENDWLQIDTDKRTVTLKSLPDRAALSDEINENLVVELYSR